MRSMGLRDWAIGLTASTVVWLLVPDVLTRAETAVFIFSIGWIVAASVADMREYLRKVRAKRESLRVHKPDTSRRAGKVINFTTRGPKSMYFVSVCDEAEKVVMM